MNRLGNKMKLQGFALNDELCFNVQEASATFATF